MSDHRWLRKPLILAVLAALTVGLRATGSNDSILTLLAFFAYLAFGGKKE